MIEVVIKPFSRNVTRLAYGKVENGQFVPTADVKKAPNFRDFGSFEITGRYGRATYTETYHLNLESKKSTFAVQKWTGNSTVSPRQEWEIIHEGEA